MFCADPDALLVEFVECCRLVVALGGCLVVHGLLALFETLGCALGVHLGVGLPNFRVVGCLAICSILMHVTLEYGHGHLSWRFTMIFLLAFVSVLIFGILRSNF